MPNPNKAKGSKFELDVERYLQGEGLDAKRPRQTGNRDVGDLHVEGDWILQLKNWANIASAVREGSAGAVVQAEHAGRPYGAAVIKKPRGSIADAYVVLPLRLFARLLLRMRA